MGIDPRIEHLDESAPSPFEVIVALDQVITVARQAYAALLQTLTYDAVRDESEQWFNDGMSHLWSARECFRESVEVDS